MKSFKSYLTEQSVAHQQATSMGLQHMGFGRYGRHGEVTHISKFGKLVHKSKVKDLNTLKDDQLKHLEHADDEVFNNGVDGARNVLDHIHAIRKKDDRVKLSQKWDGSPSVVLGTHPETKKFFVASKSAFNKDPKINYTEEDIDRNHGHAPGLAAKLKEVLRHGPKLGIKGVVQGDLLYGEDDKEHKDDKVSFKPNTIKYSIHKDSDEGKKITRSKIGIALHTEYHGGKAVLNPDVKTEDHPDVYKAPVQVNTSKVKFDDEKLSSHASNIGKKMQEIPKKGWDAVSHPDIKEHAKTYINQMVRGGKADQCTAEGLHGHIHDKYQKLIDGVKTPAAKAAKIAEREHLKKHVADNADHFDKAFDLQNHINDAKHHILDASNRDHPFEHSYEDGTKAEPEGLVSIGHHGPVKFVKRAGFSAANFAGSANRK